MEWREAGASVDLRNSAGEVVGWIWTAAHYIDGFGGFKAVVEQLPDDGRDFRTFLTYEEAQAWLIVAVVYAQITGELAPIDIHKEDVCLG